MPTILCCIHQGDVDENTEMRPQLHRGAAIRLACGLPNELPPIGPRYSNVSSIQDWDALAKER